ncbi:hypothetical protein A9Q84_02195 [Halobacteriovorax marinus]|uniref:Potassium channel domain-containing protein n=1 Tax=Halobacteriovorax marinus TaxID=97084 RepID=A0A1Y5FCV9_9BACT|nr:hypothetical protein A9Q84_02195 [Halobacteriovorax marinus]
MANYEASILNRLTRLFKSKEFIVLTIVGNASIFIFSGCIYMLERDLNPSMNAFIDAIWWGFATVTSVGYGDVVPVTTLGKIIGILLMLLGTALFATYTALFANSILGRQVSRLKGEFRYIRSGMKNMQDDIVQEEGQITSSIDEIRLSLERLESKLLSDQSQKEK